MALYLIAFNDEWVPELTDDDVRDRGAAGRAVIAEMSEAGVFVFSDGGLDESTVICSVDPKDGTPVFTDGPFVETKEHLGGFCVVDVADDAQARYWAGRVAVAVGWPQEVHRFPHPAAVGIRVLTRPFGGRAREGPDLRWSSPRAPASGVETRGGRVRGGFETGPEGALLNHRYTAGPEGALLNHRYSAARPQGLSGED